MIFIDTINGMWRNCGPVIRLIIINVAVFALIIVGQLIASLCNSGIMTETVSWLECPGNLRSLALHPWTLVTYMFMHVDIFHLIFNMLWLYWFGSVFMLTAHSRQIYLLYIGGGIAGAILFSIFGTLPLWHPASASLAGASASVIAIVTATAILHPGYRWNMFLLGEISLKWIAVITIIISLLGGGSAIPHLGGAAFGLTYALMLRRGRDLSLLFTMKSSRRFQKESRPRFSMNTSDEEKTNEQILDEILDKVRRSGYASLSGQEKRRLIEVSRKSRQ